MPIFYGSLRPIGTENSGFDCARMLARKAKSRSFSTCVLAARGPLAMGLQNYFYYLVPRRGRFYQGRRRCRVCPEPEILCKIPFIEDSSGQCHNLLLLVSQPEIS